ncbi:TPA: DUF1176 domain-containing protein [Stenotrophomonas maltophilia]
MHRPLSALIVGLLLPLASHAGNTLVTPGIEFVHHDWFLACDNTGTCRAAGYGPENADSLLGLMLERAGGPGTAVKARLRVGEDGESAMPEGALRLQVNGRDLGPPVPTRPWRCGPRRLKHCSPPCPARPASRSSTATARAGRFPTVGLPPYC